MTDETPKAESGAERARRRTHEAAVQIEETLSEIMENYGVLLELRDRKIRELEAKLAHLGAKVEPDAEQRIDFNVLVIEESPLLRAALVAGLQRKFSAFGAADGQGALEGLTRGTDAILASLHVSGIDAVSMIRRIRKKARKIPILVMGETEDGDVREILHGLGVRTFFRRPVRLSEVVARVEALAVRAGRNRVANVRKGEV